MANKNISQVVKGDGKAATQARSAPNCFLYDDHEPDFGLTDDDKAPPKSGKKKKRVDVAWGKTFSPPRKGNDVDFYVTGEEYFTAVSEAIMGATKSVYITGWQVNFDVQMPNGKNLWECLKVAVDNGAQVFVMPWLSPKIPVISMGMDRGDFETMLAVYQLNAGLGTPRAFCLPAVAQSDVKGILAAGFSHHQKSVVIDNSRAFVGGMDLAYGRRDDAKFDLKAGWRVGSELYNPCVPPIHELTNVERRSYISRGELLAGSFENVGASFAQFVTSPTFKWVAYGMDGIDVASEAIKDKAHVVQDFWNSIDVFADFKKTVRGKVLDVTQDISDGAIKHVDVALQGRLSRLSASGAANAANVGAALLAWMAGGPLEQLPWNLSEKMGLMLVTLSVTVADFLSETSGSRTEPYEGLVEARRLLPVKALTVDPKVQPRMPWHDVHCSIKGPAVFDVAQNFVRRWNGIAAFYENAYTKVMDPTLNELFKSMGLPAISRPRMPRVADPGAAGEAEAAQGGKGTCWIQTIRSAPALMLHDEEVGLGKRNPPKQVGQNNCLKAMLTAIHGAQRFIYIENQFFQSEYGEQVAPLEQSGPTRALVDIFSTPGYRKFAETLGIAGAEVQDIPGRLRWSGVDKVLSEHGGPEFMTDLKQMLGNNAMIQATLAVGEDQPHLLNPIGDALSWRIHKAIVKDNEPFHVYMVLPEHPEGALDTIIIMSQLHLTMQSLVFAKHSLVNRIRRAILQRDYVEQRKLSEADAEEAVKNIPVAEVEAIVKDRWTQYLTLLNLRNWATIGGRPVTEQVYVHSKLLIADDRVAVIGSSNINDRSALGDRDSELAVIVRDDTQVPVALNGKDKEMVSAKVHDFRVRLWEKLFGITGNVSPAPALRNIATHPAAPATWKLIQQVAMDNAEAYSKAFEYLPRSDESVEKGARPSSIWPTWKKDKLDAQMPFDELFWRAKKVREEPRSSWSADRRPKESAPNNVHGFIVALPTSWTKGEKNLPGINLRVLAENDFPSSVPAGYGPRMPSLVQSDELSTETQTG